MAVRHTRVISEKIKDATIATVDIANRAVTQPKTDHRMATGSGTVDGAVTTYLTFPFTFAAVPAVAANAKDAGGWVQIVSVSTGSVGLKSEGTISVRYFAYGSVSG